MAQESGFRKHERKPNENSTESKGIENKKQFDSPPRKITRSLSGEKRIITPKHATVSVRSPEDETNDHLAARKDQDPQAASRTQDGRRPRKGQVCEVSAPSPKSIRVRLNGVHTLE